MRFLRVALARKKRFSLTWTQGVLVKRRKGDLACVSRAAENLRQVQVHRAGFEIKIYGTAEAVISPFLLL